MARKYRRRRTRRPETQRLDPARSAPHTASSSNTRQPATTRQLPVPRRREAELHRHPSQEPVPLHGLRQGRQRHRPGHGARRPHVPRGRRQAHDLHRLVTRAAKAAERKNSTPDQPTFRPNAPPHSLNERLPSTRRTSPSTDEGQSSTSKVAASPTPACSPGSGSGYCNGKLTEMLPRQRGSPGRAQRRRRPARPVGQARRHAEARTLRRLRCLPRLRRGRPTHHASTAAHRRRQRPSRLLARPSTGLWNAQAMKTHSEMILAESVIDALCPSWSPGSRTSLPFREPTA